MIKYFIFDFDGTIVDNLDSVFVLVQRILAKKNMTLPGDLAKLREIGVRQVIRDLKISKLEWLKYYRVLKQQIRDSLLTSKPVKSLPEVLAALSENSNLYVMSSNKKSNIEEFLHQNGLSDFFKGVFEDHSYFGKHKTLEKIIKDLKLLPKEVAYVGDETRDIEAAKKANIIAIAVTWGFEGETPLQNEGPDFLLHRPKELVDLADAKNFSIG